MLTPCVLRDDTHAVASLANGPRRDATDGGHSGWRGLRERGRGAGETSASNAARASHLALLEWNVKSLQAAAGQLGLPRAWNLDDVFSFTMPTVFLPPTQAAPHITKGSRAAVLI